MMQVKQQCVNGASVEKRMRDLNAHCQALFRIQAGLASFKKKDVCDLGAKRRARIELLINLLVEQCELSYAEALKARKAILGGDA